MKLHFATKRKAVKMLIIDAGHGGKDSGAVGSELKEKHITLQISLAQARLCEIYGIKHYLTRNSDITTELIDRTTRANKVIHQQKTDSTILISNHVNSSDGIAKGFEIIKSFADSTDYADRLLELVKRSDILAVRKVFNRKNNSGTDYFHMIRETSSRAYILEWGFIKNITDMNSLRNNMIVAASLPIIAYLQDATIQKNK